MSAPEFHGSLVVHGSSGDTEHDIKTVVRKALEAAGYEVGDVDIWINEDATTTCKTEGCDGDAPSDDPDGLCGICGTAADTRAAHDSGAHDDDARSDCEACNEEND